MERFGAVSGMAKASLLKYSFRETRRAGPEKRKFIGATKLAKIFLHRVRFCLFQYNFIASREFVRIHRVRYDFKKFMHAVMAGNSLSCVGQPIRSSKSHNPHPPPTS